MPEQLRAPASSALGLIADIGGTNARFALVPPDGTPVSPLVLRCADFDGPETAAKAYLAQLSPDRLPTRGAFAVASPVLGDEVAMTNNPWRFSTEVVRRALGLERLDVVNDFVAQALCVPHLKAEDRALVVPGQPVTGAPIAVVGPGTGLGISTLLPSPEGWRALPGEGGHATLAAADDREARVISWLRARDGHVSAERLLSGPGLVNLYDALRALSPSGAEAVEGPADVTRRASAGEPLAGEALDLFFAMLGTQAGNVALTVGARGGVVLAGGILPRLLPALLASRFAARFSDKGRFQTYLGMIPVELILHPFPAFLGLAGLVRRGDLLPENRSTRRVSFP